MKARRRTDVFSLSFLDCMSCGFGAVILFFMIINASVSQQADLESTDLMSETDKLEIEVLEGRKNFVKSRNSFEKIDQLRVKSQGDAAQIAEQLKKILEELAQYDKETLAKRENLARLRADVQALEAEKKRLSAAIADQNDPGRQTRTFLGEGDRQYLTGLKVGGERVLILVDASASMLDRNVVDIIRRRNMSDADKIRSAKWRQAVASVDWITAQLPAETKFQIYTFNTETKPVIAGSDRVWLDVATGDKVDEAIRRLRSTVPQDGTNLHAAYAQIKAMQPRPDNVFLLVDSLPTQDGRTTRRKFISGPERQQMHNNAQRELPSGVPVNVLLYPMEGDYAAPIEFWKLAFRTGGSFMSVSKDWP